MWDCHGSPCKTDFHRKGSALAQRGMFDFCTKKKKNPVTDDLGVGLETR